MSLSALGAGALVFGAGRADASIIYSGVINQDVGFKSGDISQYISPAFGPLNADFDLFKASHQRTGAVTTFGSKVMTYWRSVKATGKSLFFEGTKNNKMSLVAGNVKWNAKHSNAAESVGGRQWNGSRVVNETGNTPFTDEYALFRFKTAASSYDYGWIELTLTESELLGTNPAYGPELDIVAWAYDNTGATIASGATSSPTPEPGTLALTGLAALALGAAGLRQWRKTRQAA